VLKFNVFSIYMVSRMNQDRHANANYNDKIQNINDETKLEKFNETKNYNETPREKSTLNTAV